MNDSDPVTHLRLRHVRFGWTSLFVFVVLGVVIEGMHGFKVDWYLAVGNETRRFLWRLAHAHGTFLSLVHLAFAWSLGSAGERLPQLGSRCLIGATFALPGGFLLGGIGVQGGDPGVGIVLVPLGALLLLVAIGGMVRALRA